MSRLARAVSFVMLIAAWSTARSASAQTWDSSGNSLLSGTFNFRHVLYAINDQYGDIGQAATLYGTITFDGNGNYTLSGTAVDSSNGSGSFPATGTYTISASGYGFLSNPYTGADYIYGLFSNGIFIGSSTDNTGGYNDLFVAAKSSGAGNATFQGPYSMAYMNPVPGPDGDPYEAYDALAQMNPNGSGGAGTMTVTAYAASNGSAPINGTETNVQYRILNSVGTLLIPSPNPSFSGIPASQVMYISQDGNFIFGGSTTGWDMFVGVRTGAGTPNGLYYQAGLQEDATQAASADTGTIYTYYGSYYALDGGAIVAHQRFFEPISYGVQDYTYSDTFPSGTAGGYTDSTTSTQYAISGDGSILIGLGIGPLLGLQAAVKAPPFSESGVFLNPTGIQNAASFAPFTTSLARGELVFLTGTGLSDQNLVADQNFAFPMTLGGVQVLVNGVAAAVFQVSSTYIVAQVPYETTAGIAQIQVVNKQGSSNIITAFMGTTSPGIPTFNGYGIAQHTDYSLVTADNPAHAGDTLLIYATGLGDVFPTIADGAIGPIPVSTTTNNFTASIGGMVATVVISEVVPTIAGDYVLAVTVPSGIPAGDQVLTIAGPDSITSVAVLPVAGP